MAEKLDDVWYSRDYPVLLEVAIRIDAGQVPRADAIAQATGMSQEDVMLAGAALKRRGLVDGVPVNQQVGLIVFTEVSGSAYLMTGLHPDGDEDISDLVGALRQAADQVSDEDDRSLLRRAADSLRGVSRDVLTGVLTAYINTRIPS
jgi:hypothetical protein